MAMVGMAGTAVGIGIAVLKEKADRRSIMRDAEKEVADQEKQAALDEAEKIVTDDKDFDSGDKKDT